MTFPEALRFLDSFLNWETTPLNAHLPRNFNLERMERLLAAMGNPHRGLPVVHVAGTKGKGSTCAFAAGILREAGYAVGMYTQPHLLSPRERLMIDGACISESAFAGLVSHFRDVFDSHRESEFGRLTFFEIYTALVFAYFAERNVDLAVLEVGMGGRLDATNVCDPIVCVIAPVGLDHQSALGHTLSAIAREKAGIIKEACPIVVAPQPTEAAEAIRQIASERRAPLFDAASEIRLERFGIRDGRERLRLHQRDVPPVDLELRLLGAHQSSNATAATCAALRLREAGWNIPDDAIRRGLERAIIHGRFQISEEDGGRRFVFDAAHTAESAAALRETLREAFPRQKIAFVVGMAADKNAETFAAELAPAAFEAFMSRAPNHPRAADPALLAEAWRRSGTKPHVTESISDAVSLASGDVVCVTGSIPFVGHAMETAAPKATATFRREVGL